MRKLLALVLLFNTTFLFSAEYPAVEDRIVELHITRNEPVMVTESGKKKIQVIKLPRGSLCSGSFISNNGYIITAGHCADAADTIDVVTYGNQVYRATIVAVSDAHDLALLHIDKMNTPHFEPATAVERGEKIFIIGSPLGVTNTLSTGVIAKLHGDRTLIDCSALPGNSGSAVFDAEGKIVGVLVAGLIYNGGATHLNIMESLDSIIYFVMDSMLKKKLATQ
jgi:S1-C subfamily serine protease